MNLKDDIRKRFGLVLLRLRNREDIKLTQQEVADEAGISRRYYNELEQGKKTPTIDVVERLANAFELKLSELCKYIEEID